MPRQHDEPADTCPIIDDVLHYADRIDSELGSLRSQLEKVRSANEDLRAWGRRAHEQPSESEDMVKVLEEDVERLDAQLEALRQGQ